jgi:8-oxo-dGTP pyrophosphatase MutT (NUDIX family)
MKRKVSPCSPDSPPDLLCPYLEPVMLRHQNPWFKVLSRESYFSIEYERPQVVVLPILEGKAIVMIRVKRPLIDDCPLELPAGDSKAGESPRMAAIREFKEETGICINAPQRFVPTLPVSEMPGRIPVLLSIFEVNVSQFEFDSRLQHDHEVLSVEAISFPDIARKLVSGEIYLSAPMAIISRFLLNTYFNNKIGEKV